MDTIVLTTANSKTSQPNKYLYKLTNAVHLGDYYVCHYVIYQCITHGKT